MMRYNLIKFTAVGLLGFGIWGNTVIKAFQPPNEKQRTEAIGSLKGLPAVEQEAFNGGSEFIPIDPPDSHDWLWVHPEPGQTFEQYRKDGFIQPDKRRQVIYLQPIGNFPEDSSPPAEQLKEFTQAYFALKVRLLPVLLVEDLKIITRINPYTKKRQLLTYDILAILKKKLPPDAFCILGITMEDLYPEDSWNFVFGMASLRERVGVFSFARYDPAFYGEGRGKNYREIILQRSCKVLAHETGHMFGLQHCIFYQCLMCGSNHLDESDDRPLHLCPVCLRKLYHNIHFDLIKRYRSLLQFYTKVSFIKEAEWIRERIKRLEKRSAPPRQ